MSLIFTSYYLILSLPFLIIFPSPIMSLKNWVTLMNLLSVDYKTIYIGKLFAGT